MRGTIDPQAHLFAYFSPESRVPAEHPLRRIKQHAEAALCRIAKELDGLYSHTGRPSIAPERLLKGQLLMALYTLRSDRQFCEQLNYNLLFRWFLDMNLEEAGLDQSNFSRLRAFFVVSVIPASFSQHGMTSTHKNPDRIHAFDEFELRFDLLAEGHARAERSSAIFCE